MTAHPDDLATKQGEPLPLDRIRQNLSRILKDNNVGTGPGVRVVSVSVNNGRDRQELLALAASLRSQGPDAAKADDWLLLGDGLCAAGCFREADAVLTEAALAARSDHDPAKQAEAHFKRFRTRCELGDFPEALVAYGAAVALAPDAYTLFPRRYEPVAILGAGGFGTVFLCRDRYADNHSVAIKALPEAVRDPLRELLEDCIAEAPADRHRTFAPVLAGLARLLSDKPTPPPERAPVPVQPANATPPPAVPQPGDEFLLRVAIPEFGVPLQEMTLLVPIPEHGTPLDEKILRWKPVFQATHR